MKNNKKLIIIITTIILLIVVLIMLFIPRNNKNDLDEAVKKWYELNQDLFKNNNVISFKAYVLKDMKLISNDIQYNNNCLTNDSIIVATYKFDTITYEVKYKKDSKCDYNESNDYIYLIGENEIFIDEIYNYQDLGAIAKDKKGNTLKVNTINNNYETNKKGTYIVEYNVDNGNETTKINRTIYVMENIEPEINIK